MNSPVNVHANLDLVTLSDSARELHFDGEEGEDRLSERIAVLSGAHTVFRECRTDLTKGESQYAALYNDILSHDAEWFAIFNEAENNSILERVIAILGTLATQYRQGGRVDEALGVLRVDGRVIDCYSRAEESLGDAFPFPGHPEELRFRYDLIRMNANVELRREHEATDAFRAVAAYEIRHDRVKAPVGQQSFAAFLIPYVLGPRYEPLTMAKLDGLSNGALWNVIRTATGIEAEMQGGTQNFRGSGESPSNCPELKTCSSCGADEVEAGQFKRCSRCQNAYYCSRDHQMKHWKFHKRDCKSTKKA